MNKPKIDVFPGSRRWRVSLPWIAGLPTSGPVLYAVATLHEAMLIVRGFWRSYGAME